MEAEFRQDLCKRTMVIKRRNDGRYDFREKMVLKNKIRGISRISVKYLNGESCYAYDIGSCQTLKNAFEGNPMGLKELKTLFSGISDVARETEKYLLDFRDLLIDPETLLWDPENGKPYFCYYPGNPEGEDGFEALGRFLMDVVDKKDEEALKAVYDYYERLCEGILLPDDIFKKASDREELPVETFKELQEETAELQDDALFAHDRADNFYSEGYQEEEEEPIGMNPLFLLLAFVPSVVSSVAYGFVFLSPARLAALGISDGDYIRVGIAVAVLSGLFIVMAVYLWNRHHGEGQGADDANSQLA